MWTQLRADKEAQDGAATPGTLEAEIPLRVVDSFISREDAAGLVSLADREGFWEESITTARDAQGEPAARRADNAWLPQDHPLVANLRKTAADTFGLTPDHVESLRLVRYRHSEAKFAPHVDWDWGDDGSVNRLGQRLASALVYLTDVAPESGGTTRFPHFDLEVQPQAGRAVVWPNVDATGRPLLEVEHAATPLIGAPTPDGLWQGLTQGDRPPPVKVAVNVWLRDRSLALSKAPPPRGGSGIQEAAAAAARRGGAEEEGVDFSSLGPLLLVLVAVGAGILGAGVIFDG